MPEHLLEESLYFLRKKNNLTWFGNKSLFLPRRLLLLCVYARFFAYVFVFGYRAVFDLLRHAPSHRRYDFESPSDKLFPSTHEDVTLRRPAVRPCVCREGTEGVAFGGMFLVRGRGVSRQLRDPESTFQRPLKHKQAPKPAGIARLLLQIIKQIKRGQR